MKRQISTTWILLVLVALFTGFGLWFANRAESAREDGPPSSETRASDESRTSLATETELSAVAEREGRVASAANEPGEAKPSATPEPVPINAPVHWRGRVLDLFGQTVANQELHLRESPDIVLARSLGDGTFALDGVPDAGLIVADSAHFVCLRGVQLPAADGAFVIVAPTISVAGFVVDETGAGIEGASVDMPEAASTLAHFPEPLDRTTTIDSVAIKSDAEGRFTYERAVAGVGMKLKANHAGYEDASVEIPDFPRTDLRIVLTKNRPLTRLLTGVVVHRDGSPAPGARVRCGDARTEADKSGAFKLALPDMVQASEPLFAIESGYQAAYVADFGKVLQTSKWELDPVRLVLGSEPLSITGRVVDVKGTAQEGWVVKLLDGTPATASYGLPEFIETVTTSVFDEKKTGTDGTFSIGGLLERDYTLFAYHSETLVRIETHPLPSGTNHFDVVVPADAFIPIVTGRVLAYDGSPVADAVVSIGLVTERSEGASSSISGKSTVTRADGSFELADVPRRFVYLDVGGDHVIPHQFPLESLDTTKAVVLGVERRCHFRVEGLPSDGETRWLVLHDAQGNELSIKSFQSGGWMSTNRQTVTTEETRVFAVSEVAIEIVLYFPYDTLAAKRALRLTPGEVTVVKW